MRRNQVTYRTVRWRQDSITVGGFWFCVLYPVPCFVEFTYSNFGVVVIAYTTVSVCSKSLNIILIVEAINIHIYSLFRNEGSACSLLQLQSIYGSNPRYRLLLDIEKKLAISKSRELYTLKKKVVLLNPSKRFGRYQKASWWVKMSKETIKKSTKP